MKIQLKVLKELKIGERKRMYELFYKFNSKSPHETCMLKVYQRRKRPIIMHTPQKIVADSQSSWLLFFNCKQHMKIQLKVLIELKIGGRKRVHELFYKFNSKSPYET